MNAQYISTELIHFVEVTEVIESFCGSRNIFIWTVFVFSLFRKESQTTVVYMSTLSIVFSSLSIKSILFTVV